MDENYTLPVQKPTYVASGLYMGAPKIPVATWNPGEENNFSTQQGVFRYDLNKSNLDDLVLNVRVNGNPTPIRSISGSYQALSTDGTNSMFKSIDPLSALFTRLNNYWKK